MRKIILLFIICFGLKAQANKMTEAYEALSIFDYFKAKQLFYKIQQKYPCESSYGLATIYFRTDNPFSNIDSAAKYIAISKNAFKDSLTICNYHINTLTIIFLADNICKKGFQIYCVNRSIKDINYFLTHFYFANEELLNRSYFSRDAMALENATFSKSSDSITQFLLKYPESMLYQQAQLSFYDFQYNENVPHKTIYELEAFIKKYPSNPNITDAEGLLFSAIQQLHSSDSTYTFIKHFSTSLTQEAAWKLLYSLSVNHYNKEELTTFLTKYPDYPYNESVLKEITLSQNILIPIKDSSDHFGFIDTVGNWIIKPQFDDALPFSEGFSAVCKNDSCYYINKEGNKTSIYYFEETENYKDGIAIVKKDNAYFLINRSGQIISKGYQDINPASNKLYVCKLNNVYGAINAKGEVMIPFSYNKLGNFKNRYAYYLSSQYGLVDINNRTLEAQWDWISDIDSNAIAVVKNNNQFGLININEQIILPCQYDYVTHCLNDIYLVVKNGLYGFFNGKEKCFVTSVEYSYNPSLDLKYYTNGKYFKLIKEEEVALVDMNGRTSINFGTYSNLFFAKCDIIRVQKKNKFGYVDRKLKPITAFEFERASDFENNLAIVSKKNQTMLIEKSGKVLYSVKNGNISIMNTSLYQVNQDDLIGLLNAEGKLILPIEYDSIQLIYEGIYTCIKNEGLYLYNIHSNSLKKL